ncbi:MAG: pyruvate kinase [Acidobacteria bacterium RIFCSPLOWO2_02_FULL_59_13]|nr:MAG: pyruvate kinase [Acidobacteria bacterium RIFCSPLOWO2_02_FULL_59_13]
MRRTKIVCTLGPATDSREKIRELIQAGMDVARLNFSHGTREQHSVMARRVREVSQELGRPVALLQDLSGPKIRTGRLHSRHGVRLEPGHKLWLTPRDLEGSARQVSISYEQLAEDVRPGDTILLDDGLIRLRVVRTDGSRVETEVVYGGLLQEHKGVNLPGVRLSVRSLTSKDEADLRFGVQLGVDYVALSFVRRAADVRRLKALLRQEKADIPVLAKLEKPEAVENLASIMEVSDGVMVARGDLGVELPAEQVPLIQKTIIRKAAALQLPVITATQMLESMTVQPRPTRAEASDVANAVFDGTDALMLSAETATGLYPIQAVEMMARIAQQVDESPRQLPLVSRPQTASIADAICESVVHATERLDVKAVVAFTRSGSTARLISKYRPSRPVYAFCHEEQIARRAALYWGVIPIVMHLVLDPDATLVQAEAELLRRKLVDRGDILAVVAGVPGKTGQTNLMKLVRVESR